MTENYLQKHYHFTDFGYLCHRVAGTIYPDGEDRTDLLSAMMEKRFCPAGNTLLAGFCPIRPNCCVLPTITDATSDAIIARAERLWKHYTGIGFDVSGCSEPINVIRRIVSAHAKIQFEDRVQRGIMISIVASHPRAMEVAKLKSDACIADEFSRVNISIAYEWDAEFLADLELARSWNGIIMDNREVGTLHGLPRNNVLATISRSSDRKSNRFGI